MSIGTLPVLTQPDDPPNVQPCHTGLAATVCGYCADLPKTVFDEVTGFGACIACGVGAGETHYSWCPQRIVTVMTCIETASCEEGDHTYSWPCDLALMPDGS